MKRLISVFLILASLVGCARVDREKLTQEVLAKDPEFAAVLEKHRELSSRMQTYERELAVRRSDVEKKIAQLRKDLVDAAASVRTKADEVKKRMDPDRARLQQVLIQVGNDLKIKREQRSSLGKQIALLKKSGKEISPEMLKQAGALDSDMAALKEQLRLLKIKLLLIKL